MKTCMMTVVQSRKEKGILLLCKALLDTSVHSVFMIAITNIVQGLTIIHGSQLRILKKEELCV